MQEYLSGSLGATPTQGPPPCGRAPLPGANQLGSLSQQIRRALLYIVGFCEAPIFARKRYDLVFSGFGIAGKEACETITPTGERKIEFSAFSHENMDAGFICPFCMDDGNLISDLGKRNLPTLDVEFTWAISRESTIFRQ